MLRSLIERLSNRGKNPETTHALPSVNTEEIKPDKLSVEEAIKEWENNPELNKDGDRIVRGADTKPVEVLICDGYRYSILVNGKEIPVPVGNKPSEGLSRIMGLLTVQHLFVNDVFDQPYELRGIQILAAQVSNRHQGFLYGRPKEENTIEIYRSE